MKITSPEIQKNDYSAMSFYDAMSHNVKRIRESIDFYKKLRKVNTSIFGYIKALALLCEYSNDFDHPIIKVEAKQWQEIILKYLKRINKKIPEEIRDEFIRNIEKDLETIVSKGHDYPEYLWKDKSLEREIRITVKNQEIKKRYEEIIENMDEYKDRLGNPISNYIKDCLERLEGEPKCEKCEAEPSYVKPISPIIFKNKENNYTYLLNDFSFLLSEEDLENNKEINAYDLEKSIVHLLEDKDKNLLKKLSFDCESSLFSVQAREMETLNKLNKYILDFID